jgi:hypothetical protein
MPRISVGRPTPITPHNQALYEAGKEMLVDSITVGREFCKFMVGISTGAISIFLAILAVALPKDYRPSWGFGIAIVVTAAVFLVSAGAYALGVFPQQGHLSLDLVESIDEARTKAIRRRERCALIGSVLFAIGVVAVVGVSFAALRVAPPPAAPTAPLQVQILPR